MEQEFRSPAIAVKRLTSTRAHRIMDTMVDTSAVRYRELWGFTHPDLGRFYHADFGRGVDFYSLFFWPRDANQAVRD